jgi:transposase, IS5 family
MRRFTSTQGELGDLFPALRSISSDKGFYSKKDESGNNNQSNIDKLNVTAHLPVKGRPNKEAQERESRPEFIAAQKQHPAVESAINALESHGFDRCPDKDTPNFERYAAMAISASNIISGPSSWHVSWRRSEKRKEALKIF